VIALLRPRPTRRGFTLFELIAVMAVLVLLAAAVLPSIGSFRGDSNQRAAADFLRGELAVARARAMEEGVPYRLAVTEDGTRIRRAPDGLNFSEATVTTNPDANATGIEYTVKAVKVAVVAAEGQQAAVADGWITIATVMPDGTCREDITLVEIKEDDRPSMFVRVRGVTASSKVVPASSAPNGGKK
jgi:prepilin-type N-terminal cleavage/methylation domain-containing protein